MSKRRVGCLCRLWIDVVLFFYAGFGLLIFSCMPASLVSMASENMGWAAHRAQVSIGGPTKGLIGDFIFDFSGQNVELHEHIHFLVLLDGVF